jgi:hypothetical protein
LAFQAARSLANVREFFKVYFMAASGKFRKRQIVKGLLEVLPPPKTLSPLRLDRHFVTGRAPSWLLRIKVAS